MRCEVPRAFLSCCGPWSGHWAGRRAQSERVSSLVPGSANTATRRRQPGRLLGTSGQPPRPFQSVRSPLERLDEPESRVSAAPLLTERIARTMTQGSRKRTGTDSTSESTGRGCCESKLVALECSAGRGARLREDKEAKSPKKGGVGERETTESPSGPSEQRTRAGRDPRAADQRGSIAILESGTISCCQGIRLRRRKG